MATVAFTAFLPEILPQLPGCSDVLATNAVRNACVDFCAGSLLWNETLDAEDVTDSSFPYDLLAPSGAKVAAVMSLSINGTAIYPVGLDSLEPIQGWADSTSSIPQCYCQLTPGQMILYPRLEGTAVMIMRLAYAPTRESTTVDSYVYQEYLEEIAAGALSKLMKIPGQPWSNPELGVYYGDLFEKSITDAATRVNKSFSRAQVSIAMRPLA